MIRYLAGCLTAAVKSKSRLVAENLCLRQQLVVLKRRQARPRIRDADRRFWALVCAGSRIGVIISSSSSRILSSDGIASVGRPIGDGGLDTLAKQAVNRPTTKPDKSSAAWLKRTRCRDSAEFRRNWRALAFESAHVRSPKPCDVATVERLLPAGGSSWPKTASRSGPATSYRFRLFASARFSFSASSTTVLDRLYTRGSPHIRTRTGWPSRWSKLAGQIRQRPVS